MDIVVEYLCWESYKDRTQEKIKIYLLNLTPLEDTVLADHVIVVWEKVSPFSL